MHIAQPGSCDAQMCMPTGSAVHDMAMHGVRVLLLPAPANCFAPRAPPSGRYLSFNSLTGAIPSEVAHLTALEGLYVLQAGAARYVVRRGTCMRIPAHPLFPLIVPPPLCNIL